MTSSRFALASLRAFAYYPKGHDDFLTWQGGSVSVGGQSCEGEVQIPSRSRRSDFGEGLFHVHLDC